MIARSVIPIPILILFLGVIAGSSGCRVQHSTFASIWPFRRDNSLDQQFAGPSRIHEERHDPFQHTQFEKNQQPITQSLASPRMMVEVGQPGAGNGIRQVAHQQTNPFTQFQPSAEVTSQTEKSASQWQPSLKRTAAVMK